MDSGLLGHVKRLRADGRRVAQSTEMQTYKARRGVGSGLEFDYPCDGVVVV